MFESPYDPSKEWDRHCEEQEREAKKRPICSECGERILDDYCYEVEDGEYICEDCMENWFKVETPLEEGDEWYE